MYSDNEDIFVSDDDDQLRSLTIQQFVTIVEEVISNEKIQDCTSLCFQVFYRFAADSIYKNVCNVDYNDLVIVATCITRLREVNKFNPIIFLDHIISEFATLPLEIIWWLHKNDIVYFVQYCKIRNLQNVSASLLQFIACKNDHSFFVHKQIVEDLLEELIQCSSRPRASVNRLSISYEWELYCLGILRELLNETLKPIFDDVSDTSNNFLLYLPNLSSYLPNVILLKFFQNVLNKILLHNVDVVDIYGAYVYQELWSLKNINGNLIAVYDTIFSKHCNLCDIITIMKESSYKINWKYTLAAVSACIKVSPTGPKDVKGKFDLSSMYLDQASEFLKDSFKGGKIKSFVNCILIIRQACMEPNMNMDYREWYSLTFGSKSNFKTKYTPSIFKFVMSAFISLVPYESKTYLKIQILQMLDPPPNYNTLVHDYKKLCRNRSKELEGSQTIKLDGGEVTLLHLIEESVRNKTISATLINILKTETSRTTLLNQLVQDHPPFNTLKQMLISEKYLSEDEMINIIPNACTK
ncbi:hypothetical protein FQR65_LT13394 [Abscondita terminalis]|nr:hypothetical protein FQR65_LT13394 [Abscondita terminalis]